MIKTPIVVNLFGGPGTGKSTGAAAIFAGLKMNGVNAELITEFAKDKTWEHNNAALSFQPYVFGKQAFRMERCRDQVDVIVTDSPLFLSMLYNKQENIRKPLEELVLSVFNTYTNINYFLNRVKPYNPAGRNQSEEEADAISSQIYQALNKFNIPFLLEEGCIDGYNRIGNAVMQKLEEMNLVLHPQCKILHKGNGKYVTI